MKKRYYDILGLPENAPISEVRKSYRKLVMLYHPDKNKAPGAEERFLQIKEAYEILTGKKPAPHQRLRRNQPHAYGKSTSKSETTKKQRAEQGQKRYQEQRMREFIENELYFRKLTQGIRWKIMKASAVLGVILALALTLDLMLPHHYEADKVISFNANTAFGIGGKRVSLVNTEFNGKYWIERFNSRLYHGNHRIYIESSWLYHNPIRIQKLDKVATFGYPINFNFYRLTFLLIPIFLLPLFTVWYKRRRISFTVLYQLCTYGVNTLMLFMLITQDRWAHLISFGFL